MLELSVLMAAMKHRPWQRMKDALESQARKHPGRVEVLIELDAGQVPSGRKRQSLLERSQGTYVCYVDDDDTVADWYITRLLEGIASDPDVVTFNLNYLESGRITEIWRFGLWPNQRQAGRMCVNHLCAWRREIATRVAWCPALGYGDVTLWFEPLFASGLIETEHHIEESLYHYFYEPAATCNQRPAVVRRSKRYFGRGLRCFWHGPEIVIEHPSQRHRPNICVRDRNNVIHNLSREELELFHTVYLQC